MLDPLAGSHPLHIAVAKAGRRAKRVAVIDEAAAGEGHRLEAPVRVARKPWDLLAVVHVPTIFVAKVLAEVAPVEARLRAHGFGAFRVVVHMVDAEQKRVDGLPREAERLNGLDNACCHLFLLVRRPVG